MIENGEATLHVQRRGSQYDIDAGFIERYAKRDGRIVVIGGEPKREIVRGAVEVRWK